MGIAAQLPKKSFENLINGHSLTNNKDTLSCKLTTSEFLKRKETIVASLKKQVLQRKELKNGYAYRFNGSDKMLDELADFVKTERNCCDFFTLNILINGNKSSVWLKITGTKAAKEFIKTELDI